MLPDLGNQHVSILPDRVGFGHRVSMRKGNAPPREWLAPPSYDGLDRPPIHHVVSES
ncbi:hypothetical protein SAMCCGM7_Ch2626 [Sinorhizobium americanum CCGM7]|nr:hypothetical protein SAMCCGM7_Ch2626 [Sinorhizobium americanum CCGM7]